MCIIQLVEGPARVKHPETALLVIEVADSSLRYDCQAKGPVYARFGIPEWIVDVQGRAIEVYRDPDPATHTYRSMTRTGENAEVTPLKVPMPALRLLDMLP